MTVLTIILLAMVTFLTRYLFIHPKLPLNIGPRLERFLSYSGPAVLTAIWVPIIFVEHGKFNRDWSNPYLIAAIIAIIVAKVTRSVYLTIGLSVSVFVLCKFYLFT